MSLYLALVLLSSCLMKLLKKLGNNTSGQSRVHVLSYLIERITSIWKNEGLGWPPDPFSRDQMSIA